MVVVYASDAQIGRLRHSLTQIRSVHQPVWVQTIVQKKTKLTKRQYELIDRWIQKQKITKTEPKSIPPKAMPSSCPSGSERRTTKAGPLSKRCYKSKGDNVKVRTSRPQPSVSVAIEATKDMPSEMIQSHRWRTALAQSLEKKIISMNACDIGSIFTRGTKIVTSLEKQTGSYTVIILGQLQISKSIFGEENVNREIAVKVSFRNITGWDNSLEIERAVYRNVTSPLIMGKNTPHLMLYVGTFECHDFAPQYTNIHTEKVAQNLMAEINHLKRLDDDNEYDWNSMFLLVLERGRGQSLDKWMLQSRSWAEWQVVLYQIIYTLACFGEVGLMHNDLKPPNIYIDPIAPQRFAYLVDPASRYMHQMTARWTCKIYDFDTATKWSTRYNSGKMTNTRLDGYMCKTYGMCNRQNAFFDLFVIMRYFYQAPKQPRELKTFVASFIDKKDLMKHRANNMKIPVLPPVRKTPIQLLQTSTLFSAFRAPIPVKGITRQPRVYHLPSVHM